LGFVVLRLAWNAKIKNRRLHMKNIKGYAWKNERTAAFYHATAEQAHEAFEEIRQRDGKLTPAAVVDSARPEESVLHEDFEWRDDVAAEKYRQGQARQMVGAVRIIREERPPVRAYVNVKVVSSMPLKATDCIREVDEEPEQATEEENEGRCYMPLEEVLQKPDLCNQMMADARRDAQTYKQKYSALASLASIMQAIDQTFEEDTHE
jgi:hypothetical protein